MDAAWTPNVSNSARLEAEFKTHVDKWRKDTLHKSSLTRMVLHPSYLRIVGMGRDVLPLLFEELNGVSSDCRSYLLASGDQALIVDPLRDREDFKKLIAELEEKAKAPPAKP